MLAPLLDDSIDYWWLDRLKTQKAAVQGPAKRFSNSEVLTLYDPDVLELEMLKTGHFMYGKKVQFLLNIQ